MSFVIFSINVRRLKADALRKKVGRVNMPLGRNDLINRPAGVGPML